VQASAMAAGVNFPGGREATFLGAFEEIIGLCLQDSREAYTTKREWPASMHAVNRGLFGYLASERAFAKTALVEVRGAGQKALVRRDLSLEPFGELLDDGSQLAPEIPDVVKQAIVSRSIRRSGVRSKAAARRAFRV
jgi:hypothetical protein